MILKGFAPYTDLWDIKSPNIFYTYSIALGIFGTSEMSVRILDLISTLVSATLVFRLIENLMSRMTERSWMLWSAAIGAILWTATNLSLGLADTAQTESFSQPFLLGAFCLWSKQDRTQRSLFICGLLLSIATFFKLTNLLFLPALILLELSKGQDRATMRTSFVCIMVLGFGMLLGIAVQLVVLVIQGSLGDFFRVMGNVIRYHTEPGSVNIGDVLRIVWQYVDLYGLIALTGYIYFTLRNPDRRKILKPVITLLTLLITSAAIVLLQGKGWGYHYVVMLPALIPLTAIGIGYLAACLMTINARVLGISVLIFAIAVPLFAGPSGRRRVRHVKSSILSITDHRAYLATLGGPRGIYEPLCSEMLTQAVESETYARDRIFVLGHEPAVYWKADRRPASRYIYTLLLSSPVIRDRDIEMLNEEVLRYKPKLVIVQMYDTLTFSGKPVTSNDLLKTDQFIPLRQELTKSYDLRDTVCGKFLMYRRKGNLES